MGGGERTADPKDEESCDVNPEKKFTRRDGHPVVNQGPRFMSHASLRSRASSLVAPQALAVPPREVTGAIQRRSPRSPLDGAREMRVGASGCGRSE